MSVTPYIFDGGLLTGALLLLALTGSVLPKMLSSLRSAPAAPTPLTPPKPT